MLGIGQTAGCWMTQSKIQLIGLCRFSYPSDAAAFRLGQDTLEGVRSVLYDPARLAQRFFYFEHVCLPALREQSSKDFEVLVLTGDHLPNPFRNKLDMLIADIPQIRSVAIDEGLPHAEACHEVMMALRDPSADMVAEFRMDDDDAVAIDFVAEAHANLQAQMPLFAQRDKLCLDFTRGYLLAFEQGGIRAALMQQRMWTPAQIFCRRSEDPASLLSANHLTAWQNMPTISHPTNIMYVRTAHETNDSDLLGRKGFQSRLASLDDRTKFRLQRRFGIDSDRLTTEWAGLRP